MTKLKSLIISRWALIAILIIAGFLRLHNIKELPPGLYPDEAIYANNGVEAWESGVFRVFYPENNGREGLWPNIIGFFIIKLGHEPWVPRSVAAVFGILTVLGVYFLTKELFRENSLLKAPGFLNPGVYTEALLDSQTPKISRAERIALLSSFLLATSFWHILFSRIAFRAIMAPMFLVWGLYFLLLSLNKTKIAVDIKEKLKITNLDLKIILYSVIGGFLYGLGMHSYIAYRATPLLILTILFLYWFKNKEKEIRQKILLLAGGYILMAILVAAPLGIYFLQNPGDFFGRTTQISVFNSPAILKDLTTNILKTAAMLNFVGDENWRHNYAGRPQLFWPVGILFIIGFFLGLKSILRKSGVSNLNIDAANHRKSDSRKIPFLILFIWLIIAALPVVISNEAMPHALRALLMAPPIFILAGFGGIRLYEIIRPRINYGLVFQILCFVILALLLFEAYTTYFIKWGRNPNILDAFNSGYAWIGRGLRDLPKEPPKYVIVEAGGVKVQGIPMPAQTVMYITDTFSPEKQKERNIFYILPNQIDKIPAGGYTAVLK